jgi:hypothetical protein
MKASGLCYISDAGYAMLCSTWRTVALARIPRHIPLNKVRVLPPVMHMHTPRGGTEAFPLAWSQHVTTYDAGAADAAWYLKCYSGGRYSRYVYLTHVMLAPGDLVGAGRPSGVHYALRIACLGHTIQAMICLATPLP